MNTQQVERELAAILQRRAEAAMNETNTQTELQELDAEIQGRARRDRRRWVGGALAAAAAAAAVVAGFALWPGDGGEDRSGPASDPGQQTAEEVADGFLEAFAAGDVEGAESYVAAGATPWEGWRSDMREEGVLRPQYILQPCEAEFTSQAGTRLTCPFDYHLVRSDELGLEPFGGNMFTILVADEKVVSGTVFQDWFDNGQSVLVEEIGDWVRENHPGDWAAMNVPGDGSPAQQRRSFRLWERHTQEYVAAQTQ